MRTSALGMPEFHVLNADALLEQVNTPLNSNRICIARSFFLEAFAFISLLFSGKNVTYGYGNLQVKKLWDTTLGDHQELLN